MKQIKGSKLFQSRKLLQEVWMTQRKNEVCMLTFDIVKVMSYGYRYHEPMLYLKSMIKRMDLLPQGDAGMHGSHIQ